MKASTRVHRLCSNLLLKHSARFVCLNLICVLLCLCDCLRKGISKASVSLLKHSSLCSAKAKVSPGHLLSVCHQLFSSRLNLLRASSPIRQEPLLSNSGPLLFLLPRACFSSSPNYLFFLCSFFDPSESLAGDEIREDRSHPRSQ